MRRFERMASQVVMRLVTFLAISTSLILQVSALPGPSSPPTPSPLSTNASMPLASYKDILPDTQISLGDTYDRRYKCDMPAARHVNRKYPGLEDCLNALLRIPAVGVKFSFARFEDYDDPESSKLPQTASSAYLGQKCEARIEINGQGVQKETSSWLAIRAAASDLAFLCARPDSDKMRTGGSVIVGDNGYIKITLRKPGVRADGTPGLGDTQNNGTAQARVDSEEVTLLGENGINATATS